MKKLQQAVGARIRVQRKARRWTQAYLAEAADIAEAHMGAIERGERWPSAEVLDRIATALQILPGDCFPRSKPGAREGTLAEIGLMLRDLPAARFDLACRILKEIAAS